MGLSIGLYWAIGLWGLSGTTISTEQRVHTSTEAHTHTRALQLVP